MAPRHAYERTRWQFASDGETRSYTLTASSRALFSYRHDERVPPPRAPPRSPRPLERRVIACSVHERREAAEETLALALL